MPNRRRLAELAYWTLPSLFCLWLYRYGLRTWFMQDDFAWLGVNAQIHDWPSFWHAVVVPSQQGTIRPLSERLFFIVFWHLFGWQAVYYHALVFATQAANLVMVSTLVRKVTDSRLAGFLAPILWMANAALAVSMSWTSGYNEILCAAFLLAALLLFLKFEETGKRRYYWLQLAVFVLGFGALELNLVYPAIALCWALAVRSRRLALSTLPLFALSGFYYLLHTWAAPRQTSGPYAMHFDRAIPQTVFTYWQWTFVSPEWVPVTQFDPRLGLAATSLLGLVLFSFIAWQAWRGRYLPAFFLTWFFITLAPLAPLRDHPSDYYLSIPSLGLAAVAALAAAAAWQASTLRTAAAVALIGVYLAIHLPVGPAIGRWYYDRSLPVRNVVLGVQDAHRLHPSKTLLLSNVSPELYDNAISHRPFRLISGADVFVAPESKVPLSEFTLPRGATARALAAEQLEVYSVSAPHLRNVTSVYERGTPPQWFSEYPLTANIGNPWLAYILGPSWYPLEGGAYRWMPAHASLRLSGPTSDREHLFLTGYCAKQLCGAAPPVLSVAVDGHSAGEAVLPQGEGRFTQSFPLPASAMGKPFVEIQLGVSRTFAEAGQGRPLALAFGLFEIR